MTTNFRKNLYVMQIIFGTQKTYLEQLLFGLLFSFADAIILVEISADNLLVYVLPELHNYE